MRCAVYCANYGSLADPRLLRDLGLRAEAAGWDGFFVYDHIVAARDRVLPSVDPWTVLAAVAAGTERVAVGPMVTPVARRRPWELAHQVAALDRLSGGRVVLGVGLGEREDFAAVGDTATDRERGDRLDEGIAILRALLAGEVVEHEGSWTLAGLGLAPGPERGSVPIWVAGRYPNQRPLRRAARQDGVFPINNEWRLDDLLTPALLADVCRRVASYRAQDGKTGSFDVIHAGISPPQQAAAGAVVAPYAAAGATWWLEVLEPRRGPVDELVARVAAGPPAVPGPDAG